LGLPDQLAIALEAARRGAEVLRLRLGTLEAAQAQQKGPKDFVTAVDREAEEAILECLRRLSPGVAVMAEESAAKKGNPERPGRAGGGGAGSGAAAPPGGGVRWVVDPLDGTTNYIHAFPHFAVSVALAEGEKPLAGVVVDPLRGEEFSAWRGGGAYMNGRRLHVSRTAALSEALALTGFPFRAVALLEPYLRSLEAMVRRAAGVRRAGSAALDLCYVACGRAEAFWELKLAPWDIAAGSLLVEEAGGRISDFTGGSSQWRTGNILATNGPLHDELVALLGDLFRNLPPA
jgi:myo-inositol-1(or 4)-monophosphatase